ncbi:MAG: ABC transporter permease [Chloroflexi bacterium]|nr:MAG: ABC transporter permease [Chloroflexota bacterium]TMG28581.1 MAG: ABC transporter permease [Chloroflexota bacterium]
MSVRSTQQRSEVSAQGGAPPFDSVGTQDGATGALATPTAASASIDSELSARRAAAARRRRLVIYALRVAFTILWLGSWELSTRLNWVDPFFVGQPSGVVQRLWTWITEGTALGPLWLQAAVTMQEAVVGFLIGAALGVVFGILLGRIEVLAEVLSPFIKGANAIPRVVLGSLFAVMFGLSLWGKAATAVVLVFFVVFFNAFQGVREVDRNLIANARILGADNRRLTTEIIIPSAMTWILASLHISFGLAIVGAVVGELFGATAGLGQLIYNAGHTFDVNGVFAGMFVLAVLALIAEGLISALENRLIKWRPSRVSGEIPI